MIALRFEDILEGIINKQQRAIGIGDGSDKGIGDETVMERQL